MNVKMEDLRNLSLPFNYQYIPCNFPHPGQFVNIMKEKGDGLRSGQSWKVCRAVADIGYFRWSSIHGIAGKRARRPSPRLFKGRSPVKLWRWAESNRRPNNVPNSFLHVYSSFGCRPGAAGRRATRGVSFNLSRL